MLRYYLLKSRGYYYTWSEIHEQSMSNEIRERILTEPLYGSRIYLPRWREVKQQYAHIESPIPHFETNLNHTLLPCCKGLTINIWAC